MPELPEVESLCRQMDTVLADEEILGFTVYDRKISRQKALAGRKICRVRRQAKSIVLALEGNLFLVVHLRMTGRLLWSTDGTRPSHTRATLVCKRGSIHLVDPRRFATVTLLRDLSGMSSPLDLWAGAATADIKRLAAGRRCPIKSFLMDQVAVGGIGNIYACEILHRAAISPWRRACDLDSRHWDKVRRAAISILNKAIACRGSSISDWADLFGRKGSYQGSLKAYGREGEPCHRCGAPIIRTVLGGRGTFFCTSCQAV
jgi:formamidopyrimidine-DNA glycosylase